MYKHQILILISFLYSFSLLSQDHGEINKHHEDEKDKHHHTTNHDHSNTIRIAGLIGHTLIKSEGSDSHIFVPSWGLDIEYWFTGKWGVGLHNDLEIESFIVKTEHGEEIERVNPIVLTVDALYHIGNGIIISAGPGVELETGKSFYLLRVGIEYEKEIGNGIDLCPAFFHDQRFDGFSTWTIALGIGKRF